MHAASLESANTDLSSGPYFLSRDVYFAETGRKAIFLDLKSDKYQAIERTQFQSLAPYLAGMPSSGDIVGEPRSQLLQQMAARGLLTTDPNSGKAVQQVVPPVASRHALSGGVAIGTAARATTLVHTLYTAIHSDRALRRNSLLNCVEKVRNAKAACQPGKPLPRWLPHALHARFYYPADQICLRDSFLVMNLLLSAGVAADWVFGVQAEPFKAHCWVQVGDLLINDSFERITQFTPILVV